MAGEKKRWQNMMFVLQVNALFHSQQPKRSESSRKWNSCLAHKNCATD
jgi:hypothetical protein